MACDLTTNHRVSQWYAFILMIISALIIIGIICKALFRLKQLIQFRYRSLYNFDDSESRYSSVD